MGEMVHIMSGDDYFDAYMARPAAKPKAAIIVLQEIFGVNADIKATTDWLATEGYLALAPDLFWRQTRLTDLNPAQESDWPKAFELMGNYDGDAGAQDIQTAIDYLRGEGCTKVGTIGFCLGGRMSFLAACRTNGDAHSSYYGVGIDGLLSEAQNITAPTLVHIAGRDEFVPPAAQTTIADGLTTHEKAQVHIYAAQDHAFARHNGLHYDAEAATLAHERTLTLFAKALK